MESYYFINHGYDTRGFTESTIINELNELNPDNIIILCLEEYDYQYIFRNLFPVLDQYLIANGKTAKLIAPYIDPQPVPNTIIVEDSIGYYHWARGLVVDVMNAKNEFAFTDNIKLFTNYNNNPKYQRAMFVDQLVKYDLLQYGIVTLIHPETRLPNNDIYQYQYHDGSKLVDEPEFLLNAAPEYVASGIPLSYLNGLIDIVSESTYGIGQFFPTEKTAKPIATLKPFLVLSAPGYHQRLLDKYNIELYDEIFDYSFDSCTDINDRIAGIINNLLALKDKTNVELKSLYTSIQDKLINNRNNYLNVKYSDNFVPKSLKSLLNNTNVTLRGDFESASMLKVLGIIE